MLTTHVLTSVGWLGAIIVFLVLALVGVSSDDPATVRAVYVAAEPITWFVIVPLALGSLASGVTQSLITNWGLIRHWWVLIKLGMTLFAAFILLLYTQTVGTFADRGRVDGADLATLEGSTFILHSASAMVLLLAATVLAIYKPRGLTRWGWRKQSAARNGVGGPGYD